MRRFDVLRVATGSYTVESKRIASRKLLQGFPGLQDLKNMQKTTKNVKNVKNQCFLPYFLSYFSFKGRIFRIFLLFGVTAVVMEALNSSQKTLAPARTQGKARIVFKKSNGLVPEAPALKGPGP